MRGPPRTRCAPSSPPTGSGARWRPSTPSQPLTRQELVGQRPRRRWLPEQLVALHPVAVGAPLARVHVAEGLVLAGREERGKGRSHLRFGVAAPEALLRRE